MTALFSLFVASYSFCILLYINHILTNERTKIAERKSEGKKITQNEKPYPSVVEKRIDIGKHDESVLTDIRVPPSSLGLYGSENTILSYCRSRWTLVK